MDHFWKRWMKEWLPNLNCRAKWHTEKPDIKENDVVLLVDKDSPRGKWKMGRVIQRIKGNDGHIRVVKIQVANSQITRPITKICPLELV